ncbi:hypothetical protein Pcinc_006118 [Petrolisthes cinctipes]|uniref:DM domain-containing protein n=1 Tax=Petrolisthes cinctipes TaxID=88211 RepID=A0AAE1GDQ5_PETCI|nr:hypothetical protein Pcinc_006118 [Petrolisthes cinctipes]
MHQQRLWRHRKDTWRKEGRDVMDPTVGGGGGVMRNVSVDGEGGANSKKQKCDMCRNHYQMKEKRGHKNVCPFQNCQCDYCGLTRKRQDVMRHYQLVKRSKVITSQQASQKQVEAYEYVMQVTRELAQFPLD